MEEKTHDPEHRDEKLLAIRDELLSSSQSPLYTYRTTNNYFPVTGQGNHYASIMFIGEAPGRNEAETGRPFCGAAGKILDALLDSIHIQRDDVYITNIVKDRPPQNRDPEPEEILFYGPFLDKQIEIIKPKVLVTLGRFSMVYIMEKFGLISQVKPISTLHGKLLTCKTSYSDAVVIIPLYHPAATIYNSQIKKDLFEDVKILKNYISAL